MKFTHIRAENFRNLSDVSIALDPWANYLIGENNIGKTNLISALDALLGQGRIQPSDYQDEARPIVLELTLSDVLAPSDEAGGVLRLRCEHRPGAEAFTCQNAQTGDPVPPEILKRINYARDDATREPHGPRGGLPGIRSFLMHLIRRSARNAAHPLSSEAVRSLATGLSEQLTRLKTFAALPVEDSLSPDDAAMLSRLLFLMDASSLPAAHGWDSIEYSAMAMMNVLNRVLERYGDAGAPFAGLARVTPDGRRILPMVLALDEPEVHLHPYMQRSLIRYYKRILQNADAPFQALLKACFDLDGLCGQLLIITHSPDALVDNFRNLIRFYKDASGKTRTACGPVMQMQPEIEKHLIMQFPDIKEAFYARSALLVEGVTESTALRDFAETLGVPTDDYGISVIDAGGEGSLRKLESLLGRFGIPGALVFDGDVRREGRSRPNEFYTQTLCFETEIVHTLIAAGAYDVLEGIPPQLDENAMTRGLTYAYLEKPLQKFGAGRVRVPKTLSQLRRENAAQYEIIYAAWLYRNKGAILGRIIGRSLPAQGIPACYRDALQYAKALALGGEDAG